MVFFWGARRKAVVGGGGAFLFVGGGGAFLFAGFAIRVVIGDAVRNVSTMPPLALTHLSFRPPSRNPGWLYAGYCAAANRLAGVYLRLCLSPGFRVKPGMTVQKGRAENKVHCAAGAFFYAVACIITVSFPPPSGNPGRPYAQYCVALPPRYCPSPPTPPRVPHQVRDDGANAPFVLSSRPLPRFATVEDAARNVSTILACASRTKNIPHRREMFLAARDCYEKGCLCVISPLLSALGRPRGLCICRQAVGCRVPCRNRLCCRVCHRQWRGYQSLRYVTCHPCPWRGRDCLRAFPER